MKGALMPTLARTTIAIALMLFGTIIGARAAEIPKQYRGEWCVTKWETIYKRCSKDSAAWAFVIDDGVAWGDWGCDLLTVHKSKYRGHRLQFECGHAEGDKWHKQERWWLGSNGRRLQRIEETESP
jgi:hypothetical protein